MSTPMQHNDKEGDIHGSEKDSKHLQREETTIDLPDVEDIPGQEHIHVPDMKQFHDTTISSADEEGEGLFDEELDPDSNVTPEEKQLLRQSAESMAGPDDEDRRNIMLDHTDADGDRLNEHDDISGADLDVPGSDEDDPDEAIGEEDEENNSYSLGGDRKD